MSNLCIYHAHCADGFGAAWAVHHAFIDSICTFYAGVYNKPAPDVTGSDVYLVDFSYKSEVILKMLETANSVTIIDHHKSAIKDLMPLEGTPGLTLIFSQEHSGAVLTWKHFFPNKTVPLLLQYIEDGDMWRFNMHGTKEVLASLHSHPFDFSIWDTLDPLVMYTEGVALRRAHCGLVDAVLDQTPRRMLIAGYNVPVINCGGNLKSDVGNVLSKGESFAATYRDLDGNRVFSLRSSSQGVDVSEVAALYGGGGHRDAASFQIPLTVIETQPDRVDVPWKV